MVLESWLLSLTDQEPELFGPDLQLPVQPMSFLIVLFCLVFGSSEPAPTTGTESPVQLHMKAGDDALLTCRYQKAEEMKALKWTRSDDCVFFYRENRPYPKCQPEQFKGRVQLANSQMTSGNISVILGNVTQQDSGVYRCTVGAGGTYETWCSICLLVEPEDPTDEPKQEGRSNLGLVVGLPVAVVLLVAVAAVAVWSRRFGNQCRG